MGMALTGHKSHSAYMAYIHKDKEQVRALADQLGQFVASLRLQKRHSAANREAMRPKVEPCWAQGQVAVWIVTRDKKRVENSAWGEATLAPRYKFAIEVAIDQDSAVNPLWRDPAVALEAFAAGEEEIADHVKRRTLRPNSDGTFPVRQVLGQRNWPPKTGRGRGRPSVTHYRDRVRVLAHYIRAIPKGNLSQSDIRTKVFGVMAGNSLKNMFAFLLRSAVQKAESEINGDQWLYEAKQARDRATPP